MSFYGLRRYLPSIDRHYLRLRQLLFTTAQFGFALVTITLVWLFERGEFTSGLVDARWTAFVYGVATILVALNVATIVGFRMGRRWACDTALVAGAPYLVALAGWSIAGAFPPGTASMAPVGLALSLGWHLRWYADTEFRDEVERWGRLSARSLAVARSNT